MSAPQLATTMVFVMTSAFAFAQPFDFAQGGQPALRVVVIDGEDAVNIIQQKTAVRPVIEVRDRNNLPVPGALVTFSIEGGKAATFGGASTLTVATNAAGQAAVTSLTPSAAGAFQIQVSAAFQGQVATATIAQTNVLTAAQAAAAAGASGANSAAGASGASGGSGAGGAGGAAGGAGGGLSGTTIGIVGAAVAGGAVAATQVAGKGDEGPSGPASSGPASFTGPVAGQIVSTLISRNSPSNVCTITRTVTATATFNVDSESGTSVSGRLNMTGTETAVSTGCAVVSPNSPFGGSLNVSGAPSALRGSDTLADSRTQAGGETIDSTRVLSFEGVLSGNSITGTIKFDQRSVSSGVGGGPVDQSAIGTFPVILTRP